MDAQKKMEDVSMISSVEVDFDLDRQVIIDLLIEIVENTDIVGAMADGTTLYMMALSTTAADTLAALFSNSEGDEHDGKEPEEEV